MQPPTLSIVIISFNTCNLLKTCLDSVLKETVSLNPEIIVVDNASKDQSAEMVASNYPHVVLIKNIQNVGFGPANNQAFKIAKGDYIVLLNSDAFLKPESLQRAVDYMQKDPTIGFGGARLIGPNGEWQPSARLFPSFLNEFLQLSGLASKYSHSRVFGRYSRTWISPDESGDVDWVTGAFAIVPKKILEEVGGFDERFFLYYEEVDLCRRIKQAGYRIVYWSDVVVTHLGGESSKTVKGEVFSPKEAQLILWRMRSELLYFRKHNGWFGAYKMKFLETFWHRLRSIKNWNNKPKREESQQLIALFNQAWQETAGGSFSPPAPW